MTLLFTFVAVSAQQAGWSPPVLAQLAYLPVLLAAALFGLRGALALAVVVTVIMTPYAAITQALLLQSSLYLLFGVVVGSLFSATNIKLTQATVKADRLSLMYTKMLASLASTVEVRDRHTQGHCERVAYNSSVLGRALKLSDKDLDTLYWSALLHDLGKIAVPEYILLKEGPLTEPEYNEVKRHAQFGAQLLESVSSEFFEIADVVRSHHERWDGHGYPQRLRSSTIPYMSRIISVVDVFEALTSQRSYRQPMRPSEALAYIKQGSSRHFDPDILEAFLACYERGDIRCAPEAEILKRDELRTNPVLESVA